MEEEIISVYSDEEAVKDGYLFDLWELNPQWSKGIFRYITVGLAAKAEILKEDKAVNIPNLLDLLNNANNIVRVKSKGFKEFDSFFSGQIELASGEKQKIFIEQNETGKFTILLPEEH